MCIAAKLSRPRSAVIRASAAWVSRACLIRLAVAFSGNGSILWRAAQPSGIGLEGRLVAFETSGLGTASLLYGVRLCLEGLVANACVLGPSPVAPRQQGIPFRTSDVPHAVGFLTLM